ncbi:Scr1 family TA system antitoxin-like transcriptional regulator [Actinokineospora sp. G85]|uniref:Scr1 family TA system antitoxin-like transcriptional regulator n=1 Tax=Actinokineospora sp. G85 TaxID=3406626 RepID=UPI003C75E57E
MSNEINESVALRIRRARMRRGWTARDLADRCLDSGFAGLSRGTIAKIESGIRRSISAEEVAVLARVLDVPETELTTPPPWDLGASIREARLAQKLTQQQVAERAGVSRTTLQALERGARPDGQPFTPSPLLIHQVVHALGITIPGPLGTGGVLCLSSERIPGPLRSEYYRLKLGAPEVPIPERYQAVLSESALLRMPGGRNPALQVDQIDHLARLNHVDERVEVQVLPFDAAVVAMPGDFETMLPGREASLWEEVSALALDLEASQEFLRELGARIRRGLSA